MKKTTGKTRKQVLWGMLAYISAFLTPALVYANVLIGHWAFDEGSGTTTADDSAYENDGTMTNMDSSAWIYGRYNNALCFDGTDDYVNCGNNSLLNCNGNNAFTISLWIKPNNLSSYQGIVGKWGGGWYNSPYQLAIYADGQIRICIGGGGVTSNWDDIYLPAANFTTGVWTHVAATYDGTTLRGYVNGKEKASKTTNLTLTSNTANVIIGSYASSAYFNGSLDVLQIYDYAINAAAVYDLFNDLRGNWDFNDGSGTTAVDSSGFGNDGTLYNMTAPWVDGVLNSDGYFHTAVYLDGTNDYVNCGNDNIYNFPDTNSNFTVSCWIRPNNLSSYQGIIGKWGGGWYNSPYQLAIWTDGRLRICIGGGGVTTNWDDIYLPSANFTTGEWTHIAATYDGTTLRGYVNGEEKASKAVGFTLAANTANFIIGSYASSAYFNGDIDKVRLYGRVLSADELKAMNLLSAYSGQNYYTTEDGIAVSTLDISSATGLTDCYLEAKDAQGNSLGTNNSPGEITDLTFSTNSLSAGTNTITVELRRNAGEKVLGCTMNILKRAANQGNEVKINLRDGIVMNNGNGFFPIGFYMMQVPASGTADFQTVANAGFNSVINWNLYSNPSDATTYLENADDYGLLVLGWHDAYTSTFLGDYKFGTTQDFWNAYISERDNIMEAVSYASQGENLLGYYTFDELLSTQITAGEDLYGEVNAEDGYHPTFGLFMAGADTGSFSGVCDIEGVDTYIKPPVVDVNWVTKYACAGKIQADQHHKPFWLVLSAQYDADMGIKHAIKSDEQCCQTYLALIHGAKGIFYYYYPIAHESTWECFEDLTAELAALSPIILTRDLEQTIAYSQWDYASETYVNIPFEPASDQFSDVQVSLRKAPDGTGYDYVLLAVNTKPYPVEAAYTISLLGSSGTIGRLFSQDTYNISNGCFSEQLPGFTTRAYTFDSNSTDPVSIQVATILPENPPASETSYPGTGRPGMTNLFRNPDLEVCSLTAWPDYCWPWNVSQDHRIGTENQSWGLVATGDKTGLPSGTGHECGDTCLKIVREGIMTGFYSYLALEANQTYKFTAYMKKVGTATQSVRMGSSTGYVDHNLTETWTRYEYSITAPAGGAPYNYFRIQPLYDGAIMIDAVQVEIGSSATDFTVE